MTRTAMQRPKDLDPGLQLQEFSARLLRLQDEERRRIARDLHDGTGQLLCALRLAIDALEQQIPATPQVSGRLQDIHLLLQVFHEIRTVSHLLHPPLLDEVGFVSAAQGYVDEYRKHSGIETTFEVHDSPKLPKHAELVLFRVLQESLTNVLRHSGSKTAQIVYERSGHDAVLSVRDSGKGLPETVKRTLNAGGKGDGLGLTSMHQRIKEIGGCLRISSDEGGTLVMAVVPLSDTAVCSG